MTPDDGLLLGIDIGTTSVKTAIFDLNGNVVGTASYAYPTYHPQLEWAEHDPNLWWMAFKKCMRLTLSSTVIDPRKVVGLAISELAPVVVPVDKNGKALRRAMIWMDRRDYHGEMTESAVAKQLWVLDNEPRIFEVTHKFLNASGFLYRCLTGRFVTYENLSVPDKLIEKQPEVCLPGQEIGTVTAEAAREIGLAEGTPAVMGFYDSMGAAIGCGVVNPGCAVEMTGHSTVLMVCTGKRLDVPYCVPHIVPGLWLIALSTSAGGGLLGWFKDKFRHDETPVTDSNTEDPYQRMNAEAAKIEPGAEGLIMLPYLEGRGQQNASPIFDPKSRGTIYGLTTSHTRAHFVRMLLEANAYESRLNIETIEKLGVNITDLRAADGGSKSDLWLQIKADVFGRPVARLSLSTVATPFGNALIAGAGVGIYENLASVSNRFAKVERVFKPRPDEHELYSRIYRKYMELDKRLRNMSSWALDGESK